MYLSLLVFVNYDSIQNFPSIGASFLIISLSKLLIINNVAPEFQCHLVDIDIPGKITFKESDALNPGMGLSTFDTGMGMRPDSMLLTLYHVFINRVV